MIALLSLMISVVDNDALFRTSQYVVYPSRFVLFISDAILFFLIRAFQLSLVSARTSDNSSDVIESMTASLFLAVEVNLDFSKHFRL